MFDKIKRRNEDFDYSYPEDAELYKEELNDYVIWYMLNQKDLKIDFYYDDWKDSLKI